MFKQTKYAVENLAVIEGMIYFACKNGVVLNRMPLGSEAVSVSDLFLSRQSKI